MKSFLLLSLLGAGVLAQTPTTDDKCLCPQVKCDSRDAVKLCQCLNFRETKCKEHCPDYVPTYLPCPAKPTVVPTPTPSCVCEQVMCLAQWPQSCYCENAAKQKCFDKCGGAAPVMQSCPATASSQTFTTKTLRSLSRTTTSGSLHPHPQTRTTTKVPKPSGTHAPCGGNRANYLTCDEGYLCMKDPYKPGCGPECDGIGICVEDKMCGGFAAFSCPHDGQVCVDDPRDECDPENGGADCGGLCVWPH